MKIIHNYPSFDNLTYNHYSIHWKIFQHFLRKMSKSNTTYNIFVKFAKTSYLFVCIFTNIQIFALWNSELSVSNYNGGFSHLIFLNYSIENPRHDLSLHKITLKLIFDEPNCELFPHHVYYTTNSDRCCWLALMSVVLVKLLKRT